MIHQFTLTSWTASHLVYWTFRSSLGSFPIPVRSVKLWKLTTRDSPLDKSKCLFLRLNVVNPTLTWSTQPTPLLPVALDCLKDRDRERPSAQELCNRLAALKDTPQYGESVQQGQRATTDGERVRIRELQVEAQERQTQEKDRTIASRERSYNCHQG